MIYINFLIKIKTYKSNFYLHKSCIPFETNHLDFELQKSQKKKNKNKNKKQNKNLFLANILWWGIKGWHALSNVRNIFLTQMHIKIWMLKFFRQLSFAVYERNSDAYIFLKLIVMRWSSFGWPFWASSDFLSLRNSWFKFQKRID